MNLKATYNFSEPVIYEDFINPKGDINHLEQGSKPGIYVWGFKDLKGNTDKYPKGFIPYYVGKHNISVYMRLQEHWNEIRGCNKKNIFTKDFYDDLESNLARFKRKAHTTRCLAHDFDPNGDEDIIHLRSLHIYQCKTPWLKKKYRGRSFDNYKDDVTLSSKDVDSILGTKDITKAIKIYFSSERFMVSYAIPKLEDQGSEIAALNKEAETDAKWKLWDSGYETISNSGAPKSSNYAEDSEYDYIKIENLIT